MTICRLLFVLISVMLLVGCRRGYKIEDNKVYFENWNEGTGQNTDLMKDADAQTFQPIDFDCECSFCFGRDKLRLYIDGKPMPGIDPTTFNFIGNYIFRDKDSAYFFGFYNDIMDCAIKGVDPIEIELIQYPWSKAGKLLIYGKDTLSIPDIETFTPIDSDWGKTKKHLIYQNELVENGDPETFMIISNALAKDKNNTYEYGRVKKVFDDKQD
jgi:hypothetical protein